MSRTQSVAPKRERRQLLRDGLLVAAGLAVHTAHASAEARPAPAAATSPPLPARAFNEVLTRMQTQTAAWNRGDIAGFCAAYAEDCIFVSPGGVTRGRRTVEERYQKKYGSATATMGQLDFEPLEHRVSPEMISLTLRWRLSWPLAQPSKPAQSGLTLIVWQRQPDGWFLVQDASM